MASSGCGTGAQGGGGWLSRSTMQVRSSIDSSPTLRSTHGGGPQPSCRPTGRGPWTPMPEEDASTAMSSDANSNAVQPADAWQIRASIMQNEEQRWTHNRRPAELSLNSRAGQPAPASVPARPRTGLPPSVDNEATALGFPSDIVSEGGLRE